MGHPYIGTVPVIRPTYISRIAPKSIGETCPFLRPIVCKGAEAHKTKPLIYYPESDGMPMAENTVQYAYLTKIKDNLGISYRNDPDVFIAGDLFWYPDEEDPKIKYAPDVMVVFGRPKGDRGSYRQWEEDGIPPQVVFEIWSPGNRKVDKDKKLVFYDRYGVEEYYTYDPDKGAFEGWHRQNNKLEEITDIKNWRSPRLGIRFSVEKTSDGPKMEIYDINDRRFLSRIEESDARESAEIKVRQEVQARTTAEAEAARAKAHLQAALEQLQKAGLPLPKIDES